MKLYAAVGPATRLVANDLPVLLRQLDETLDVVRSVELEPGGATVTRDLPVGRELLLDEERPAWRFRVFDDDHPEYRPHPEYPGEWPAVYVGGRELTADEQAELDELLAD